MRNKSLPFACARAKVLKKTEEWKREHPKEPLENSEEFKDFRNLFNQIKHKDLVRVAKLSYSLKWVRRLADWITFEFTVQDLEERAGWSI